MLISSGSWHVHAGLDTKAGRDMPRRLTFTLSALQRLANPPEMAIFALIGTLLLLIGSGGVIGCLIFGATLGVKLSSILILALFWAAWRTVRGPTKTFYRLALGTKYINSVELSPGRIDFGVDELSMVLPVLPQTTSLSSGIFGTHVLRFPLNGYSLVIPKAAISRQGIEDALAPNGVSPSN
jgi:hypothetical protein